MDINSAMSTAVTGIKRGMRSVETQAANIASAKTFSHPPEKDVTEPLVYMIEGKNQVEASAKVVRTADEMLGSVLDIKA